MENIEKKLTDKEIEENKRKGETARLAHADFFDHSKQALEDGYYFEAMSFQYASMESRINVILAYLHSPCAKAIEEQGTEKVPNTGISAKTTCIKNNLFNSEYPYKNEILEKTKLSVKMLRELVRWYNERNKVVHRLYEEIDNYQETKNKAKLYAENGAIYSRALYDEASRLRRLNKKHPEYFENFIFNCEKKCDSCDRLREYRQKQKEIDLTTNE